ncbi:MFS transporter [Natronosporangium hydrolyticum]|uniref:MFS transporter n=1 Tax=Natronosporangium hydrolyticum TaxID=2811111 RepID=A0A895Y9K0_9ACTN|nr:MFS transporter [Natronosporangium hydrolyticum]QSB14417.1 MFS transporter [Natronosporangium hydrolyticum]
MSTPSTAEAVPPRQRPILLTPAVLRLWTGTTASGLATWALPFLLGLAVVDGTLSATGLGIVLATRTVGFLVAVPISGVLADRYSRRGTVLWAGIAAGAATPVMFLGLGRSVALMAVAAVVVGAGQGACRPAFQALTAEIVAPERRQAVNAAMSLAVRLTTFIAPGLAVLLGLLMGVEAMLLGTALLWLCAGLLPPPGLSPTPTGPRPPTSLLTEFADGVREARRHPWFLAGLAALTAVITTGYSATSVALPIVSRDEYGTEVVLAAALAGYTAGGLLGAVLIARWRPSAQGWAALAALAGYGFAPLALLLPVHPVLVVAAYVLAGLGIELFNVPWFTATQREVEPTKLARVSSLDFLLSYGLAPIGLALIAPAIATFGATAVLLVCAAICFLAPAFAALAPGARRFSAPPPPNTPTASIHVATRR